MVTKVVFLGTPEFAVPTLEALASDPRYEVLAVFTQPDRPSGRGQHLTAPPVKQAAIARGIPVHQFASLRKSPEAVSLLRSLEPDLLVVVAFGQILKPEIFDLPPWGALNVHGSILPAYRGAAPVIHALLHGEAETGVTVMKIDAGMDTGDTLSTRRTRIGPATTAGDLTRELAMLGAQELVEAASAYVAGQLKPVPQNHDEATYAPMIDRGMARIDWSRTAHAIHNSIRAFNPWPGAFSVRGETEVKIWRSRISCPALSSSLPGTILEARPDRLIVQCGEGALDLLEVQAPNRRRISGGSFVNGFQLEPGQLFG